MPRSPRRSAAEPSALATRLTVLEGQMTSLRTEYRQDQELLHTLASPPWKRLWWFVQGYRLWSVGRWY